MTMTVRAHDFDNPPGGLHRVPWNGHALDSEISGSPRSGLDIGQNPYVIIRRLHPRPD